MSETTKPVEIRGKKKRKTLSIKLICAELKNNPDLTDASSQQTGAECPNKKKKHPIPNHKPWTASTQRQKTHIIITDQATSNSGQDQSRWEASKAKITQHN